MDAAFLNHYDRELAYLRELGGEFASQYPRVAGQLGLDEFSCADPFVERLLEGFAFMSARVQRRMDAEFPQLTRAFLDTIFPHYARPVPAAGIFQFSPDNKSSLLAQGFKIPKSSKLYAAIAPGAQTPCRFETTTDLQLWPIELRNVEIFSLDSTHDMELPHGFHLENIRSGLRFEVHSTNGLPLQKLPLQNLRIHLRGGAIARNVHESLLAHCQSIYYKTDNDWIRGMPDAISPHGFAPEEALLPGEPRSFSGYQLLQDYFLLPEKYLFVDIGGLQPVFSNASADSRSCSIVIGLRSNDSRLIGRVSEDHFALHCVPAVNLFQRRADRIAISQTNAEHHLIVDRSRPLDFEIWSIDELRGHTTAGEDILFSPLYAPPNSQQFQTGSNYYSHQRRDRKSSPQAHASMSRARASHPGYAGTELFLTLTDSDQEPYRDAVRQLSATVTCTNRDLPLLAPDGGWRDAFNLELSGPIAKTTCIHGPTQPGPSFAHSDGDSVWRLISHLTPNYLSLLDEKAGGSGMLREMLQLYCQPGDRSAKRQTEGISSIESKTVVRRLPYAGPITHGHGVHIELMLDEAAFEGGGIFLLGSVLERFFARFAVINSFTQTSLISLTRGPVHRWPVRIGEQPLL